MDGPARSPVLVLISSLIGMIALGCLGGLIWGAAGNNAVFLIGICGFLMTVALMLAIPLLRNVRFSLRTLLIVVLAGGTCVSLIVARSIELKSIGIVGALLMFAMAIGTVARSCNLHDDW